MTGVERIVLEQASVYYSVTDAAMDTAFDEQFATGYYLSRAAALGTD